MNQQKPDRVRLYQFYMWMNCPAGLFSLYTVLAKLRDIELLHLMQGDNQQAATIAWAEYGKRRKLADITFHQDSVDVLEVKVTELIVASHLAAA